MSAFHTSARLLDDGIIDPRDTRNVLAEVLAVCREAGSLSEAGRKLFAVSRQEKKVANDADRLRKYLSRFGLEAQGVRARAGARV